MLIEIHKFENGNNQPMSISIIVGVVAFWMNIPHTMRELKSTKLHFTQTQASSVPEFQPIALFLFSKQCQIRWVYVQTIVLLWICSVIRPTCIIIIDWVAQSTWNMLSCWFKNIIFYIFMSYFLHFFQNKRRSKMWTWCFQINVKIYFICINLY